jgi:hypothetical protein
MVRQTKPPLTAVCHDRPAADGALRPPSGRIREGDDEASRPSVYEGRFSGDPQVGGPAVPQFRQAEQRTPLGRGRRRDVGRGDETLGPWEREVMVALVVPQVDPIPQKMDWMVPGTSILNGQRTEQNVLLAFVLEHYSHQQGEWPVAVLQSAELGRSLDVRHAGRRKIGAGEPLELPEMLER